MKQDIISGCNSEMCLDTSSLVMSQSIVVWLMQPGLINLMLYTDSYISVMALQNACDSVSGALSAYIIICMMNNETEA